MQKLFRFTVTGLVASISPSLLLPDPMIEDHSALEAGRRGGNFLIDDGV